MRRCARFELERASLDLAGRVDALEQVADRLALRVVEREQEIATLTARLDAALEELRERVEAEALQSMADGRGNGEKPSNGDARDVFDGLIEVEVGPLSDFDQLASFEDAANGIGAAEEISVKRFTKGRATLEMHLSEPVALLRGARRAGAVRVHRARHARGSRRARRRRRVAGRASLEEGTHSARTWRTFARLFSSPPANMCSWPSETQITRATSRS